VKERVRSARTGASFEALLQDFRFSLRMLGRRPGFSTVVVLTLALGIGANSAVFSIVDAALLKSLPFRDANRLVAISETHPSIPEIGASVADFEGWKEQSQCFTHLAAYDPTNFAHATLVVHGEPIDVQGVIVSHDLFPLLGIAPASGRNFLAQEDALGEGAVVILSNGTWTTHFDANPNILGRSITLNRKPYTVIGVLPPGIRFPENADLWLPLGNLDKDDRTNRSYHPLFAIGSLKPAVTVSRARVEMAGIADRLASAYPQTNHQFGVNVRPLLETYVGGLRTYLLVLWAAVGLVLLIACANVASLLLARWSTRQQEMAVRSALGASRLRLIRQGVTESIVLAGLGGLLGLLVTWASTLWFSDRLGKMFAAPILRVHQVRIDPAVVGMTLLISTVSAALFGVLPAIRAGRTDVERTLQSGSRASQPADRQVTHRLLIAGEVALAAVVLVSTGLLVRTLRQLIATSPGFRADHLLALRIALPSDAYKSDQEMNLFYQRLLPKVRALPGVEDVGAISQTPLMPNLAATRFLVDGSAPVRPGDYPVANFRLVSPNYFQTMDIPLLKGRWFSQSDLTPPPDPAVVINRTLAEEFLPGQNPIGRKLLLGVATGKPTAIPIVGVVGGVRDISMASPAPAEMYFAGYGQVSTVVVRSATAPANLTPAIRASVAAVDPSQSIFAVETGEELVDQSIARQRFSATLLALFSALALILGASGIYGVASYAVAQRIHEIGVRMALGAEPMSVLGLILREEMLAPLIGIAVGVAGAMGATTVLSHLLYGVGAKDPVTYSAVCLVLAGASFLACFIPARRAMRVDPMVALRYE
jgi:predicted permease